MQTVIAFSMVLFPIISVVKLRAIGTAALLETASGKKWLLFRYKSSREGTLGPPRPHRNLL